MKISARVKNSRHKHRVELETDGRVHKLSIPPKATGFGSSTNGGELLFLALATCYCNDVYREAARRGVSVWSVEVEVEGEFGSEGEPAGSVSYRAKVGAAGSDEVIREVLHQADRLAEIQNTLRTGTSVRLGEVEIVREASS